MNVLLIGGGARENAMGEAIVRGGASLYTIMSNINPGLKRLSVKTAIMKETDIDKIIGWEPVKNKEVDLAIVGPEAPLEAGIVDELEKIGIKCASPTKEAAQIETSKKFMRDLMSKYNIKGNLMSVFFNNVNDLEIFLKDYDGEFVVKPVGLTGGKGVRVQGDHFNTKKEGLDYAITVLKEGIGEGKGVLIEEKVNGEEYTLQAFSDGNGIAPMPLVQDFKRAYENDQGPNTGGMGSYSMENHLLPFLTEEDYAESVEILKRIISAMRSEGIVYRGVIYGQFMITKNGPRVIEINARFGDPEAMNVLGLLDTNFIDIIDGMAHGKLPGNIKFREKATVVKYVVPRGYGTEPRAGEEIFIDEKKIINSGARIYYGSVNYMDGRIYTTHSRSVAIEGIDDDIVGANGIVENALRYVSGNVYVRHDIGTLETIAKKLERMKRIR